MSITHVVIDIKSAVIFVKLRSCYTSRRERTVLIGRYALFFATLVVPLAVLNFL